MERICDFKLKLYLRLVKRKYVKKPGNQELNVIRSVIFNYESNINFTINNYMINTISVYTA